jgi:hypothetical protein
MTYNGWANYETYNVDLWVSNDYACSIQKLYIKRHIVKWSITTIKHFVEIILRNRYGVPKTPNLTVKEMENVDWEELANIWNEED